MVGLLVKTHIDRLEGALKPAGVGSSAIGWFPLREVLRSTSEHFLSLDSLLVDVSGKLFTPRDRMSHQSIRFAIFGDRGHTPAGSNWDQ